MDYNIPLGDDRCLVCNACNRLSLLDLDGLDALIRYLSEYKALKVDLGTGNSENVGIADKRNGLCLFLLRYLKKDRSKSYEIRAVIRAIDAIYRKQKLPSMMELTMLVRKYTNKYDPYGYWDNVDEFNPMDVVTKQMIEFMNISNNPKSPNFVRSPFYEILSIIPDTTRRLPAIEVKNVAECKFKFEKNVWTRLTDEKYPLKLYLFSRKDSKDPETGDYIPNKDEDTPIAFPTPIEVWVNNEKIKANFKGLKNRDGSVNPVDLTPFLKSWRAQNVVKIIHVFNKECYSSYCALIKPIAPQEILTTILNKPVIPYTSALENVKKLFGEQTDNELITTSTIISLKCPISYTRMSYPVRSKYCEHLQCFDGLWFLHSQLQVPTWMCPVCQISLKPADLYVCEFSMRVLNSCANNVEQIELAPDSTWKPIYEKEDQSDCSDEEDTSKDTMTEVLKHEMVTDTITNKTSRNNSQLNVVSLLSDEEDDTTTTKSKDRGSKLVPTSKNYNSSSTGNVVRKSIGNEKNGAVSQSIAIAAYTTLHNDTNHDDEDDDLPLSAVARKRGSPREFSYGSYEINGTLASLSNNATLPQNSHTHKKPHLQRLAPKLLAKEPLKNTNGADANPIFGINSKFKIDNQLSKKTLDPKATSQPTINPSFDSAQQYSMRISSQAGLGSRSILSSNSNLSTSDRNPFVSEQQLAYEGKNRKASSEIMQKPIRNENRQSQQRITPDLKHVNDYKRTNKKGKIKHIVNDQKAEELTQLANGRLKTDKAPELPILPKLPQIAGQSHSTSKIASEPSLDKINRVSIKTKPPSALPIVNPFLTSKSKPNNTKGAEIVKGNSPWFV